MPAFFNLTAFGIILLGVLDWKTGFSDSWNRVIGGLLWITGMGLAIRGVTCLGIKNTTGSSTGLVIKGPYRWTRNPQYLGFMLGLIGWGLMSDSTYTLIAGIAGWIPLYLVPCVEEPWLVDKYGAEYADYLKTIPRFLFLL